MKWKFSCCSNSPKSCKNRKYTYFLRLSSTKAAKVTTAQGLTAFAHRTCQLPFVPQVNMMQDLNSGTLLSHSFPLNSSDYLCRCKNQLNHQCSASNWTSLSEREYNCTFSLVVLRFETLFFAVDLICCSKGDGKADGHDGRSTCEGK